MTALQSAADQIGTGCLLVGVRYPENPCVISVLTFPLSEPNFLHPHTFANCDWQLR